MPKFTKAGVLKTDVFFLYIHYNIAAVDFYYLDIFICRKENLETGFCVRTYVRALAFDLNLCLNLFQFYKLAYRIQIRNIGYFSMHLTHIYGDVDSESRRGYNFKRVSSLWWKILSQFSSYFLQILSIQLL